MTNVASHGEFTPQRLKRLFHDSDNSSDYNIQLAYLHPDNCCGLSILGKFAINAFIMAVCLTLLISIAIIEKFIALPGVSTYEVIQVFPFLLLEIIAYFIFMPLLFFLPLSSAHDKMLQTKTAVLKMIGTEYNQLQATIESKLINPNDKINMEMVNQLDALHKYFNMLKSVPVWPFDFKTLSYFFGTFIVPILFPIIIEHTFFA